MPGYPKLEKYAPAQTPEPEPATATARARATPKSTLSKKATKRAAARMAKARTLQAQI